MSTLITNPFQENTYPGIQESSIIPILLSSLSTTESCLMFLIERDMNGQNIFYRSRNCEKDVKNGNFCPSCQELFDNLCHYLHLKKSCNQFQQENSITEAEKEPEDLEFESVDKFNSVEDSCPLQNSTQALNDINLENSLQFTKEEVSKTVKTEAEKDVTLKAEIRKEKKYLCKYCKNVFPNIRQRSNHVKFSHPEHLKERKIVNFSPNTSFHKEKKHKLKEKIGDILKEKKITNCPFCPEFLPWHFSISKHLLERHYNEKDNPIYQEIMKKRSENKMICSDCGKDFEVRQAYYHHLYKEHKVVVSKDFLCNTCGEGFITKYSLDKHNEKVHENKPKLCVECNKTYPTKLSFSHHIKAVHTAELIECKECGKKLHPKTISRHIQLVHIKDRTNKCSECPNAFVLKNQLNRHVQQLHQALKPYGCEKCPYRASNVYEHL